MRWLLIVSIAILLAWLYIANPLQILSVHMQINLQLLAAAGLMTVIYLFARILRWKVFLKFIGTGISYTDAATTYMSGLFLSLLTPGRVAEPVRGVLLKSKTQTKLSSSFPVIIVERVIDLIVILLLSIVCIFSIGNLLTGISLYINIAAIAAICLLVFILCMLVNRRLFAGVLSILFRIFKLDKNILNKFTSGFFENTRRMSKRALFAILLITVAAWILESAVLFLSIKSFGLETDFIVVIGIVGLTQLIGLISALPSGLGSMEAVMTILLATHIPMLYATIATLLYRALTLWVVMITGFFITAKFFGFKNFGINRTKAAASGQRS